ncbi:hypothetical protein Gotur_027997, partial [Gossypium turneri]
MDDELVSLSLEDGEDDVILVSKDLESQLAVNDYSLVSYFLTASIVHFLEMKNRSGTGFFLSALDFQQSLVFHQLEKGEDPTKVPLIFVNFWVQVHELPVRCFSKTIARQLGDFIEKFLEYDLKSINRGVRNLFRNIVQLDVRKLLKRKKKKDLCLISKIILMEELVDMGWDLSLRAPSKRAAMMS